VAPSDEPGFRPAGHLQRHIGHRRYLALVGDAVERGHIEVHAHVEMTNHFHLLGRSPLGRISAAMHGIESEYARGTTTATSGRVRSSPARLARLGLDSCWRCSPSNFGPPPRRNCSPRFSDSRADTTLRSRRDEWEQSGLFQKLLVHALGAYHRVIGIDLTHLFIDGCNNRALQGGDGTGFDPKHPGKRGWKFLIATDAIGIPIAFTTDTANRNDYPLMFDVLDDLQARNLLRLVGSFHADRGFNYNETPTRLATMYALTDFRAPTRNDPNKGRKKRSPSGPRWIVEAANSWLRNNGQIANNTDRKPEHREAALCLTITILLVHRISHPKHSTWRPIR
jgi:hypothetical protein